MIERKTTVYDEHEMMQAYGDFYAVSSKACFNADDVPQELHPLVPYAEFWGIADDLQRENLIQAAPSQIASNLKSVVAEFDDHLDLWLAGPEAAKPPFSEAYVAFSAMRMASDFI